MLPTTSKANAQMMAASANTRSSRPFASFQISVPWEKYGSPEGATASGDGDPEGAARVADETGGLALRRDAIHGAVSGRHEQRAGRVEREAEGALDPGREGRGRALAGDAHHAIARHVTDEEVACGADGEAP